MSTKTSGLTPPLNGLLTLGCPGCTDGEQKSWRRAPFADYAAMGIGVEHIPELLRLAFDRSLANGSAPGSYGPVHAARALGAMRPPEVLPDLIELTRRIYRQDDDLWLEDMPAVFAHFGEMAIDPIARVAADSRETFGTRLYLLDSLEQIGTEHPETRDRVVAVFVGMLKYARYGDPALNACIISSLVELNAAEALEAIRAAFATGLVDELSCGRLEEVEQDIVLTPDERSEHWRADDERIDAELDVMSKEEAMGVMFERLQRLAGKEFVPLGIE